MQIGKEKPKYLRKKNIYYQEIYLELCDDQKLFLNVNQVCFEINILK